MLGGFIPIPDFSDPLAALSDLTDPIVAPLTAPISSLFGTWDESDKKIPRHPGPQIRLISFPNFKANESIPRMPEDKNLTTTLESINRAETFIIFISHRWLRSSDESEGWDGRPHPDTANHDVHKILCEGIDKLLTELAPGVTRCFLWIDYSCLDQKNPSRFVKIDEIMECCDCLLTPIFDDKTRSTSFESRNLYEDYHAKNWNEGPKAYLTRSWCRLEMFYAANVPIVQEETLLKRRVAKLNGGLALNICNRRRPHLIYGSQESRLGRPPIVLPLIQNSDWETYNPEKGTFTHPSDKPLIDALISDLKLIIKPIVGSYEGDKSAETGKRHGRGKNIYASGAVYDGMWVQGKKHGNGIYYYPNGDVCEGIWVDDKITGQVIYRYSDGDVYEGEFANDQMHGSGRYTFAYGDVYEGNYSRGERVGEGRYRYRNGDIYEVRSLTNSIIHSVAPFS